MERTLARRAKLELVYRGVNLDLQSERVSYTDYAQAQLDELEVRLEDRDGLWRGPHFPGKGERVQARIICQDWHSPSGKNLLDCGDFEIDEVTLEGPPDMVSIKGFTARITRNSRTERKVRVWESADLHSIAGDIAERAGLKLMWEGNNATWERKEQRQEGDLNFLLRLCKDTDNLLKVAGEKLIVYANGRWDSRPPSARLERGVSWIKRYSFKTHAHDVYRAAVVSYWDPRHRKLLRYEHHAPGAPPTGEVLRINQRVESLAEAKKVAAARLQAKNRAEVEAHFTLVGEPSLHAATTVTVKGFGLFDGLYFVETARHELDSQGGYTTELTLLKRQAS